MKVKLLIDEDVHAVLAEILRKRGYDAINIHELGGRGISDEKLMVRGIKEKRCVLTFNTKDFVLHHKKMVD